MERQLSETSILSYSDSELDMIDFDTSSLSHHSHFFAPSGPPHHRYSTPLILISHSPPGGSDPSPISFPLVTSHGGAPTNSRIVTPDRLGLQSIPQPGEGTQYINKDSLAHDLSFLATMPELCDVTFLVGDERQSVCAVKAILAARSR